MKRCFFIASLMTLSVSNIIAQTYVYPPSSSGYNIDKFPSQTITIGVIGDEDGFATWTSSYHGLLGTKALLTVSEPDQYRKLSKNSGSTTTPFNVRNIQDPDAIVVTDNGNGTITISGIDPWFVVGGGGYNFLLDMNGNIFEHGKTSYTAPIGTYILVTSDGFSPYPSYRIPINANFGGTAYVLLNSNGGSGGGAYIPGATVTINAGAAPVSKVFSHWTANPAVTFANAYASTTTFNMPSYNVEVTANWKEGYYLFVYDAGTDYLYSFPPTGYYGKGDVVNITAVALSGKTFDKWITDGGGTFADPYSATTTFTMAGDREITVVKATYKDATKYTLTVSSGTGGGSFAGGAVVNIEANTPPSGKVFDKWTTSNGGTFANVNASTTTFTMPANNVTVTATYKEMAAPQPLFAVFDGLAPEYTQGALTVTLKMKGTGATGYTFKVNGTVATSFNPNTKGTFLIEAASPDGKTVMYMNVIVK